MTYEQIREYAREIRDQTNGEANIEETMKVLSDLAKAVEQEVAPTLASIETLEEEWWRRIEQSHRVMGLVRAAVDKAVREERSRENERCAGICTQMGVDLGRHCGGTLLIEASYLIRRSLDLSLDPDQKTKKAD